MKNNRWLGLLLVACLAVASSAPVWAGDDDPDDPDETLDDLIDDDDLDDPDDEDDDAEERAEKLLEDLLEARFGEDADLDDLEDDLEDWLEQQLEQQGNTDDLEDRLEQELDKRLQRLNDDDDDGHGQALEALDEEFHQLWQLEEELDESAFPALPDQAIALLTPEEAAAARASGLMILQEQPLPELNAVLITFTGTATLPLTAEPNHLYQLDNAPVPAMAAEAATPLALAGLMGMRSPVSATQRIGMMDSSIDPQHPCLHGMALQQQSFYPPQAQPDTAHGTAMASVMGGHSGCGAEGVLRQPDVFNAVVFARSGQSQGMVVASAAQLVAGLNWLLQQQVGIINMSLSGPPNRVLEHALNQAASRGVLLVASAGNEGPAAFPRFPAAYPAVIAVTAVDARRQIYERAAQGGHIELAAPGVQVQVAGTDGVTVMSGTSVAAAMATAVLASQAVPARNLLPGQALDLGESGRDPVFGWGLLQWAEEKNQPVME